MNQPHQTLRELRQLARISAISVKLLALLLTTSALAQQQLWLTSESVEPSAPFLITWTPTNSYGEWAGASNSPGDVAAINAAANVLALSSLTISVTNITDLTISGFSSLLYIDASDNALTSVNLTNCPALNEMYFNFNSIGVTNVNLILHMLSTNSVDNGIVIIDNQTPAAAPDNGPPDGIAAKTNLINRGWTVTTD